MKNLSIITICFNSENVIEKTIQSILNQSYADYEYIIIDGGSVDKTLAIVEKYKKSITHIISEPDTGIYDAQNKGIKLAEGKYLLFINSGDYLCNNQVLEDTFKLPYSEDILYGDIIFRSKNFYYRIKSPNKITTKFMLMESLPHPSTFISRELIENIGMYDERYRICADYDFFMKAIFKYHCSMRHLPMPISVFNLDGISSKSEKSPFYKSERRRIQRQYLSKSVVSQFEMFKPLYIVFLKKMKNLYSFLKSILFRKYCRFYIEFHNELK